MSKLEVLKLVIKDEDRKPIYKIVKELLHCAYLEKEIPYYYFTSFLYKKGTENYQDFIGRRKVNLITKEYFLKGNRDILEDKLKFGELLKTHSISAPKTLANSKKNVLYIKNKSIVINSTEELINVLNHLVDMSQNNSIFVKPLDGIGGSHTFKFTNKLKKDNDKISSLKKLLDTADFIFQETIVQHAEINKIYDKSINAIRVHSYYDRKRDKVEIISSLMRFGSNESIVDNGNLFIAINSESWKLEGIGKSLLKNGGQTFNYHPNSGEKLNGFQVPFGELIEDEVSKAAKIFKKDFIGWDVAITEDGPIIIEGNDNPHLIMAQIASGGIKNHKGFVKVFSEFLF